MPDRLAVFRDTPLDTEIVDRRVASSRDYWRATALQERRGRNDEARRADRAEMRLANLVLALAGLLVLAAAILALITFAVNNAPWLREWLAAAIGG